MDVPITQAGDAASAAMLAAAAIFAAACIAIVLRRRKPGNVFWVWQQAQARKPWAMSIEVLEEGGTRYYCLALYHESLPDCGDIRYMHNVRDSRDFAKQAARWVNAHGFAVTDSEITELRKGFERTVLK